MKIKMSFEDKVNNYFYSHTFSAETLLFLIMTL